MKRNRKQDTAIRSEGAERYVQAYLMLEMGIVASKASRNMPASASDSTARKPSDDTIGYVNAAINARPQRVVFTNRDPR